MQAIQTRSIPPRMKTYRITFSDGQTFVTGFNGSPAEAGAYYVRQRFFFENSREREYCVFGVSVEEVLA